MKIKFIPWLVLSALLVITFFSDGGYILLNKYAIQVVNAKLSSSGTEQEQYIPSVSSRRSCHVGWLSFIDPPSDQEITPSELVSLLACSPMHMRMLQRAYPENAELAQLAIDLYPNHTAPLYWFINATDPKISASSKPLVERILEINPRDGLAWRYLGIILINEGDIPAAIEAHINCCFNGDPGANGCYNAGRLYEQVGVYEKAINFYRLSRHEPYRVNADRLEEMLVGSD